MVWRGCERSVITYSSLISACEKAGQWELALELFSEMQLEGCRPNVVTYNSLITACAQGETQVLYQWTCGHITSWRPRSPISSFFEALGMQIALHRC